MHVPRGFQFNGVACGIKPSGLPDLALIATLRDSVAVGVYTQNVVRAASIDWNRTVTPTDRFRALVINSGNANACTGDQGRLDNHQMAVEVAKLLDAAPEQVGVLSTGVIGHLMPMEKIRIGIRDAVGSRSDSQSNFESASRAILTTDKGPKTRTQTVSIAGGDIRIASMAKGAGMIGPNMATMLAMIMTDAKLGTADAQKLLNKAADHSFNRISVEGHTSTNDALLLICSGKSNVELKSEAELDQFSLSLTDNCIELAKLIPADGEGASHLIAVQVTGADSVASAECVARTVAASALVKTAITGADPNWGRIVSAAGYSGVPMNLEQTELKINSHCVFKNGQPVQFDAAAVSRAMADHFETKIELKIGSGSGRATHWTSDLTVDYVRFNSEYTT